MMMMSGVSQRERLHNAWVRLTAFAEFFQRQAVVVVFIHLVEDLVHSFLRRIVVL